MQLVCTTSGVSNAQPMASNASWSLGACRISGALQQHQVLHTIFCGHALTLRRVCSTLATSHPTDTRIGDMSSTLPDESHFADPTRDWLTHPAAGQMTSTAHRIEDTSTAGDAAAGAPRESDASPQLSQQELEERLRKVVNLTDLANLLAPFDPQEFNPALLVWQAIKDIPAQHRHKILDRLTGRQVLLLWRISSTRYAAAPSKMRAVMGDDYSIWDEFPEEPDQVAVFEGKASLKGGVSFAGVDRFQKAFFLHPSTYELYGRALLGRGPLGDALYPLYYSASIEPSVIPATQELSDMQLSYLPRDKLGVDPLDLPNGYRWPAPGQQRYPFSGGLVDYMRAVGPGVFVGCGYKQERAGLDVLGQRYLTFVLVKKA